MIVENLHINGFRNFKAYNLTFSRSKNLIFGSNGTGKTSILEALFILGFGKSFLNVKKSDVVNFNSNEFTIQSSLNNNYGMNEISAIYNTKFSLFLNGKRTNIFEINKYFYPVFFSSSNFSLYTESKPLIRKMFDRFIFGVNSLYIHYILCYNKAVKQKNVLLKTKKNLSELSSWNRIISEMGEKIVKNRMKFVDELNSEIKKTTGTRLGIKYIPSVNTNDPFSSEYFFNKLEDIKEEEIKFSKSLIGPHLDNFELNLNSKNLKFFSSGEKKINLLLVYISFIELFKKIKDDCPVFLVDDFDTAMDKKNIDILMKNYPEIQVIATSVNGNDKFDHFVELKREN